GNEGWWLSTVTVTLTASYHNSGVATTSFRVDGGGGQTYPSPIQVSGDGEHTVDFYSTDNAGNVEGWHSVGFRIDATAPQTAISLDGTAGDGYWFHSPVTVDITATDAGSGVASIEYRLDGGTWARYTGPLLFDTGVHTFDYYAVDASGLQEAVQTQTVSIDFAAPQSEASLQGTLGELGWYRSNVLLAIQATDATSGVASIAY